MAERKITDDVSLGDFMLYCYDGNHYEVERVYIDRTAMQALRDIWALCTKEPIPTTCSNNQSLGKRILDEFCNGERKGIIQDFEIVREADNSISVYRVYGKGRVMQGLRECSEHFKFPYDKGWNNMQLGARLMKYLKELKEANKKEAKQ